MNYILGYPKSGTNWLRYYIETTSDRPTYGEGSVKDYKSMTEHITGQKMTRMPIAQFFHYACEIGVTPTDTHRLLLIVRDYKTCIPSWAYSWNKAVAAEEDVDLGTPEEYFTEMERRGNWNGMLENAGLYGENTDFFNYWKGPKMIIYYEDFGVANQPREYAECDTWKNSTVYPPNLRFKVPKKIVSDIDTYIKKNHQNRILERYYL